MVIFVTILLLAYNIQGFVDKEMWRHRLASIKKKMVIKELKIEHNLREVQAYKYKDIHFAKYISVVAMFSLVKFGKIDKTWNTSNSLL
jgi:hypothetical protein